MYDIKTYHRAQSVNNALALLANHPEAHLIAGGTDVLIKLRHHNKQLRHLVDIHGLKELFYIKKLDDGVVRIGSGTTFTYIMESPIIAKTIPSLAQALTTVAGPQIRNMATIGGNICNGAPSADVTPPAIVLGAEVEITSLDGVRYVPLEKFYLAPGKVDLTQNEIATAFIFKPENYQQVGGFYYKYAIREAMDIATIGCAAACRIEKGVFQLFKLAYGVAAPTPIRTPTAEKVALNQLVTEATLNKIQRAVLEDVSPRDSWRASKAFRLQIIQTLAKRVVIKAIQSAGGSVA